MYSVDLRWRGIVLLYVYGIDPTTVSTVLGILDRSLSRWYQLFKSTGNVLEAQPDVRASR
jgi:hypothetical protein